MATNLFFVFVRLNGRHDAPKYHIVPRADVAKYVSEDHKEWLSKPGRKGQAHKDNSIRKRKVQKEDATETTAERPAPLIVERCLEGADPNLVILITRAQA